MKNKVFSLINVIGLTIGLSASFVIGLMIYHEYTYDTFHPNKESIFRVTTTYIDKGESTHLKSATLMLSDKLKEDKRFKNVSQLYQFTPVSVENLNTKTSFRDIENVTFASNDYFQIFDYEFLAGNRDAALNGRNETVLSIERAQLYFPNEDVTNIIGKQLVYNDSLVTTISGIFKPFKQASDLSFQEFVSFDLTQKIKNFKTNYQWINVNTNAVLFVEKYEDSDEGSLATYLNKISEDKSQESGIEEDEKRLFNLQPLTEMHFNERFGLFDASVTRFSESTLKNLGLIALFLLLLACINFVNLNTASATKRAKEIGVRKTLGSSKKQLIVQFLSESFLLTIFASVLSLIIVKFSFTWFDAYLPQALTYDLFGLKEVILSIILLICIVAFSSGIYPAFIMSSFKAVEVLRDHIKSKNSTFSLRKGLIVFQFGIAQVFIIGTIIVASQIEFMLEKDMGFESESIISVSPPRSNEVLNKKKLFQQLINNLPQVRTSSLATCAPASNSLNKTVVNFTDETGEKEHELNFIYADTKYRDLFDLKLLAGRVPINDTINELLINETFMKELGFTNPNAIVGRYVTDHNKKPMPIVGVVKDYNFRSLRTDIESIAISGDLYRKYISLFDELHIAIKPTETTSLGSGLNAIEEVYKKVYPNGIFEPKFLDESIANFYQQETKLKTLLFWIAGLAILISSLGLLGLVIHTITRKTKEIGIRKVLGASFLQIQQLLYKEFMLLISLAFLIAIPIAYLYANNWLQGFAFKIELNVFHFVFGGAIMLVTSLIVLGAKTFKVAFQNPVNSLRSE